MSEYDGISLYSGGLDSILAYRLLSDQGLKILAIRNKSFFFPLKLSDEEYISQQKENYGVELMVSDITEEYIEVVKKPRFGYGRWMNPCLDCKLFMYRRAEKVMKETGASFIATGEVLGQRPMTQHRAELNRLANEARLKGIILRPLSAKLLKKTAAEESGLVDRSRLLDISGRGRRRQMRLASEMGINNYPSPAGGCHLTDDTFARRLKDMFLYGDDRRALALLKTGRHFRLSDSCRIVVGREHRENVAIESQAGIADALLVPLSHMGPSCAAYGNCTEALLDTASGIIARYGDAGPGEKTEIRIQTEGKTRTGEYEPLEDEAIRKLKI